MADVKWNEEQIQAINAKDSAVLVSAAAGSGKTAVLVERVINMLTDKSSGVMADELLIVTFTRLAAEEMKTRINKRLTKLLDECITNPEIDEAHLRNQQLLLDKANISTIDSFCREIVKSSYTRFDISPDYRIGDNSELTALRCRAVEECAEEFYKRDDFKDIASLFTTSTSDRPLKDEIISFYNFLSALPFPERWMEKTLEKLEASKKDVKASVWADILLQGAKNDILYIKGLMDNNCEIFEQLENTDDISESFPAKRTQHLSEKSFAEALCWCRTWDDISSRLESNIFFERAVSVRKLSESGAEIYEDYKSNRKEIQEILKKLRGSFLVSENELVQQIEITARNAGILFEFIKAFTDKYTQLKKEKNILDFSDIERFTLLTLAQECENGEYTVDSSPDSIRYNITDEAGELAKHFKQVIVDEYQDVNQLQDLIFKIISDNDRNLFVVGDVKQSIYGFRQAMPDIFINRKTEYRLLPDDKAKNIVLKRNYRSRDGVTDYVNFVFANLMQKELGNLAYEPEDYLVPGAEYIGRNDFDVYVHINNLEKRSKKAAALCEAKKIAKIIRDNVGIYDVTEAGTTRKAQYRDITILMRSVKNTTVLTDYLKECGIPVVTETKSSLLECREVQMVIDLLRVIDNPLQDIPLYSVLVSPMYGFTPQQAAQLRCKTDRNTFLYKNILAEIENVSSLKSFVEDIEYYREIAANNPTDVLINIIYRRTSITEFAAAQPNGEIIINNLRLLYDCSKNFENELNKGISAFIRYIDHSMEAGAVPEAQTGSNTDGNAVKIMTMHHSKGLEFPICILAGIGRQPISYKDKMYFERELGIGLQLKDYESSVAYKSFIYNAIVSRLKNDSIAEELRVLYVALTRAREQLHLVGSFQKLQNTIKKLSLEISVYNGIISSILIKNNYMLHWIILVTLMMKPEENQSKNPLWKYASTGFLDKIANNPAFKGISYRDIFLEIDDISEDKQKAEEELKEIENKLNPLLFPELYGENSIDTSLLDERFNKKYKYQGSVDVPSVVTPSSMNHRGFTILDRFIFEEKGTLTRAERGTAMHRFMEYANLEQAQISVKSELERLTEKGYLSENQSKSISVDYVERCLKTDIMQRYLKSDRKYREVKFEVMVKAEETGFEGCGEEHLLRGAVDCAFEENGELVIIDYKTDYVNDISILAEKYAQQLRLYKIGLSSTLNKPVRECVIYSFYLNEYIKVL